MSRKGQRLDEPVVGEGDDFLARYAMMFKVS